MFAGWVQEEEYSTYPRYICSLSHSWINICEWGVFYELLKSFSPCKSGNLLSEGVCCISISWTWWSCHVALKISNFSNSSARSRFPCSRFFLQQTINLWEQFWEYLVLVLLMVESQVHSFPLWNTILRSGCVTLFCFVDVYLVKLMVGAIDQSYDEAVSISVF